MDLTPEQLSIARLPLDGRIFLSGPAGTGKTSAAVARLRFLLEQGVPADSVLLLTPQRFLQEPFLSSLEQDPFAGGQVTSATLGGLARRMSELFWPIASESAGFAHPDEPPIFLTLETAQYYMAHIVRPLLDQGYFESITIDRNRLYQQILDNLNKSALIGFPHTEIASRLDAAYYGDPAQRNVYANAQDCANRFRQYCLDHNLLDFSLQMEIFTNILWPHETVHSFLTRTYRHLVYDNLEEDGPRAHDLLREWLPDFESALLLCDEGGGYRIFLGADPQTAWRLRDLCEQHIVLTDSLVMAPDIENLSANLSAAIIPENLETPAPVGAEALSVIQSHFYPELLDGVAGEVHSLIAEAGLPASEIVILAPYLSDALRFSIVNRLEAREVPWRSHRPSRSLKDEPASHALLTLAALAHPGWEIRPPKFDVAYALMESLEGLDLIRAQLLAEIVYHPRDLSLAPFDGIKPDIQERITFSAGMRYSMLREWLLAYRETEPLFLDHFLRKIFGEVLSQPGFRFRARLDSVRVASSLVESVKRFRQATESTHPDPGSMGTEYLAMLQDGVIAAQYLEGWQAGNKEAVLVAPAYTFLMMNRPAAVQFWLDAGSAQWYERLSQPITHPYVLSREWPPGRPWTDADEVQASRESMQRLVTGLLHRCRSRVYLCLSELGESGFEQRGDLLRVFQRLLNRPAAE
jgi:hypothetical protein